MGGVLLRPRGARVVEVEEDTTGGVGHVPVQMAEGHPRIHGLDNHRRFSVLIFQTEPQSQQGGKRRFQVGQGRLHAQTPPTVLRLERLEFVLGKVLDGCSAFPTDVPAAVEVHGMVTELVVAPEHVDEFQELRLDNFVEEHHAGTIPQLEVAGDMQIVRAETGALKASVLIGTHDDGHFETDRGRERNAHWSTSCQASWSRSVSGTGTIPRRLSCCLFNTIYRCVCKGWYVTFV